MIFAQSYASGETPCVGRWIALEAGLPVDAWKNGATIEAFTAEVFGEKHTPD